MGNLLYVGRNGAEPVAVHRDPPDDCVAAFEDHQMDQAEAMVTRMQTGPRPHVKESHECYQTA